MREKIRMNERMKQKYVKVWMCKVSGWISGWRRVERRGEVNRKEILVVVVEVEVGE